MKLSARNVFKGKITKLITGAVNSEVVLELSGGQHITAIITNEAAVELALAQGKEAYAVIKATSVIVAVD